MEDLLFYPRKVDGFLCGIYMGGFAEGRSIIFLPNLKDPCHGFPNCLRRAVPFLWAHLHNDQPESIRRNAPIFSSLKRLRNAHEHARKLRVNLSEFISRLWKAWKGHCNFTRLKVTQSCVHTIIYAHVHVCIHTYTWNTTFFIHISHQLRPQVNNLMLICNSNEIGSAPIQTVGTRAQFFTLQNLILIFGSILLVCLCLYLWLDYSSLVSAAADCMAYIRVSMYVCASHISLCQLAFTWRIVNFLSHCCLLRSHRSNSSTLEVFVS